MKDLPNDNLKVQLKKLWGSVDPELHVIFIHGLTGSYEDTWKSTNSDETWPVWLQKPHSDVSGYAVDYDSGMLSFGKGREFAIYDIAIRLVPKLNDAGIGIDGKPIVIITHSLGGIIAKEIFVHCANSHPELATCIRSFVFIASPHKGSDLARWLRWAPGRSKFVRGLGDLDGNLHRLNEQFAEKLLEQKVPYENVVSFFETKPMWVKIRKLPLFRMLIVSEKAADPDICDNLPIDGCDHMNICKLTGQNDELFKHISGLLGQIKKPGDTNLTSAESFERLSKNIGLDNQIEFVESIVEAKRLVYAINEKDNRLAIERLSEILTLDSQNVWANCLMAYAHLTEYVYQWLPGRSSLDAAIAYAEKALEISRDLPSKEFDDEKSRAAEAYGQTQLWNKKLEIAERYFKLARSYNHRNFRSYYGLAHVKIYGGSPQDAFKHLKRASYFEGKDELNASYVFWMAIANFLLGDYSRSIRLLEELIKENDRHPSFNMWLAVAYYYTQSADVEGAKIKAKIAMKRHLEYHAERGTEYNLLERMNIWPYKNSEAVFQKIDRAINSLSAQD